MISFPGLALVAPPGSIIGVIEEGQPTLAAQAACEVLQGGTGLPELPGEFVLDHWFSALARVPKAQAVSQLEGLRRSGAAIVLLTADEELLENCSDEIWWLRDGRHFCPPVALASFTPEARS